jgi:hypothetical protein
MGKLQTLALRNAEELRHLYGRIGETLRFRSDSDASRANWSAACAEFHQRYTELFFPGGTEAWNCFLRGESVYIENALAFLEADPWCFRSGYQKQIIWNRFKRLLLSEKELERLERIARSYLPKKVRWEFWHMAKFVRLRASAEFWQEMEQLATSAERSPSAIKANWLMLVRLNVPVRQCLWRQLRRSKYQQGYVPILDLPRILKDEVVKID